MKNLIVRTISGIVFLLVMLAALLLGNVIDCGKYFFALGMLFALIVMMHEFYRMRMNRIYRKPRNAAGSSATRPRHRRLFRPEPRK